MAITAVIDPDKHPPSLTRTRDRFTGTRFVAIDGIPKLVGTLGNPFPLFSRINIALGRPEVPEMYSPWSDNLADIQVFQHTATVVGGGVDRILVRVDYATPEISGSQDGSVNEADAQLSLGGTTQGGTTEFWFKGSGNNTKEQMFTKFLASGADPATETTQPGAVEFSESMPTYIYTRREPGDLPIAEKVRLFRGTLNDAEFDGQFPRHTLKCTDLSGTTSDGGITFQVTYAFQFNPDTWNPVVIHRDPKTGDSIIISETDFAAFEALQLTESLAPTTTLPIIGNGISQGRITRERSFPGLNLITQ